MKKNIDFLNASNRLDVALLIIRVGIGFMFILHGYPKLLGGMEKWTSLGLKGPGSFGLDILPAFWGFMAAVSETLGGLLLILGILVRTSSVFLFLTMFFAAGFHIISGKGSAYHAIESAIVFTGLFVSGPGRYTIMRFFRK